MQLKDLVRKFKAALNAAGCSPPLDENNPTFGSTTESVSSQYDVEIRVTKKENAGAPATPARVENPAYKKAKTYEGKGEHDKGFVAWLGGRWRQLTGLNWNGRGIIGASLAWCGLFFAAMHTDTGLSVIKGAAGAANWRKAGVEIVWVRDGIPQGAEVAINHNGNCGGSGNHITWADGDCAPQDLIEMIKGADGVWKPVKGTATPEKIKPKNGNAVFPGYGGNQGNMVKRSMYGVREICAVRWPHELKMPPPVTKSIGCSGVNQGKESTR